MLKYSRLVVVMFLAMLQLVAPLAHAHARESIGNGGLHIPGLEIYSAGQSPEISGVTESSAFDDALVMVDTGIKQNQSLIHNAQADNDNSPYLLAQLFLFDCADNTSLPAFPPYSQVLSGRLPNHSHKSRAPPAQSLQ
ncbi:hypothetical protein JCM14076_10500 [Methylosoma difficile]